MFKHFSNTETFYDCESKLWKGPKKELQTGSNVSLGKSIQDALLNQPDHISQICDSSGKRYTNEQILTLSIRIAQRLEEIGVHQEDVVGICASNTDFLAPLAFGALFCGAILSILDPSFDKDGVRHICNITKPKIIFCDGGIYQIVKESFAEIDPSILIFTMKDHLDGVRSIEELILPTGKEASFTLKPLKRGSSQTAAILCSSGTTGLPKGVCVSHESLLYSIFLLSSEDKLLYFSSIYWIAGIRTLLHGTITGSTRIITDQKYSPELFLRMIEEHKINVLLTLPSQMALAIQCSDFRRRNLNSVETYVCGGGALHFAVFQEFAQHVKGCQMITGYGMTELAGVCCIGVSTKPGENGKLMPNMTVKIIDDDDGKKLGIGERGEICIKAPFPWAGYYKNAEATNQIYDQDGYIHSGDIGYFDESGSLFIVDRKKDILKYNSFHFSPSEIEEIIMEIPDVVEVCVCGIPDIILSFLPSAAVVKVPGSNLTEEDIAKHVAGKMAHFNHLRGGVYFLDALPKTVSGKNVRAKIQQLVETLSKQRAE